MHPVHRSLRGAGGCGSRGAAVPVRQIVWEGRYLDDLTGFVSQFPLQRISVVGRQDAVESGLGVRTGVLNGGLGPAYQVLGVQVLDHRGLCPVGRCSNYRVTGVVSMPNPPRQCP